MKDLEQNNFPVQKKKKKSPKELGKFKLLKIRKLPEDFCMNWDGNLLKRVFTLRKCLHIHKVCKSIEDNK